MRKLLLLLFVSVSMLGSLRAPESLGKVKVVNTPSGFGVAKGNQIHIVQPDCMDTMLRNLTFKQRNMYLLKGGSFELNQANTGEYTIKSVANLKGGGPIAGWIAWALVMAPGMAIIAIVKKCDKSGNAPTGEMFENLKSIANVVKSFGDTCPLPAH